MCIIFEIWSLLSHRTSHTLFCSWFYVYTSGWMSLLTLAVKLYALTTRQTAGIPFLLQAVLWPCQVVCLHWWLQRLCLLTSKSTGMLADKDCQSVEALQLEGFSDKIMRCKACLAVNHGDALLALRKPWFVSPLWVQWTKKSVVHERLWILQWLLGNRVNFTSNALHTLANWRVSA